MTSMTNLQGTNPVTSNMTNPTSSTTCQQQAVPNQQDLIKLLTQHFNQQQPYQLNGLSARLAGTHPASSVAPKNSIDLLHQSIAHLQQQQQPVNRNALNLPLMNGRVDLAAAAAACLANTNSNDLTFLGGQMSHSPNQVSLASVPITTSNPITTSGGPLGHPLGPRRAEPQMGGADALTRPFINDMNLFSALSCFNMNSEQLMLSLQQQYLIQMASAANRQYGLKQNNLNASLGLDAAHQLHQQQHHFSQLVQHQAELIQQQQQQHHQHYQNQLQKSQQADQGASKKAVDLIDPQGDEGRELLKFSISTILGQASPAAGGQERGGLCADDDIEAMSNQRLADGVAGQPTQQQTRLSSPECDPNALTDLSSDSSSTNTSLPQSSAKQGAPFDHCQSSPSQADLSARASSLANQVARFHQSSSDQQIPNLASQQHTATLTFLAGPAAFPWTSTARGKPRRGMMRRAVFSDSQRVGLEKRFQLQKYISKPDRKKLAEKLGLRDSQVKIWFQNRRMKWRNSKERELLSAGGSREQTLPTRNNPNPDLSDVGETIKKLSSTPNSHATT